MMHEFNTNSNVTEKAKTAAMNVFLKGFSENYDDRYIDLFVFSPYYGTLKDPYICKLISRLFADVVLFF